MNMHTQSGLKPEFSRAISDLTTAFGEAYIAALYVLTKDNPDRIPTAEEIRDEFIRHLKATKTKQEAG